MRRLLPFALLLAACAKPEPAKVQVPKDAGPVASPASASLTPAGMAKAMDVPLYPGAEAPDGLSTMPKRISDGTIHYLLVLATKDSPARVNAWYTSKLGLQAMGKMLAGKTKNGNDVIVTVGPEGGRTLVRIKSIAYGK